MKEKEIYNQTVTSDQQPAAEGIENTPAADERANMTAESDTPTDTVADEGDQASQLAAEAAAWKDRCLRLQAEFDNYRKRTLREKMELVETGGKKVLLAMLPVRDDVQRALAAMGKSDDAAAIREGVELIAQKFTESLRQQGVTEIAALDAPFDPDLHEAVAKFAAGEEKRGRVIDVVQAGYMLGDKVLRFAKVVVGE